MSDKKNKYILMDRDGVINVEKNYMYKIEEFEYEKNVVNSLEKLRDLGYKFAIITNQAGIAKGYYTEEDYFKLQNFIENDLLEKGIKIEKTYFCPHHPKATVEKYKVECECRKPNSGNFEKAIKELDIDVENSYMIGDRVTDLIPANKLGFETFLITTGYGKKHVEKLKEYEIKAEIVENFEEIVKKILD